MEKLEHESLFEWKLRCCKAKFNKETALDWQEIADLLNLNVTGDHLRKTAYGLLEYDNYIQQNLGLKKRILSLSDLHIPFETQYTILEHYKNIDVLVLNGDICDMQAISKFSKAYRISPMEEIIKARQYLIDLISYLQPRTV